MTFQKIAITIIAAFENRDFTIIAINDDFMFLRKCCAIRLLTLIQTFHFQNINLKTNQLNFENAVIVHHSSR